MRGFLKQKLSLCNPGHSEFELKSHTVKSHLKLTEMQTEGASSMTEENDVQTNILGETENFIIWEALEPDGEKTYHLELGRATCHFFTEEWNEFLQLMASLQGN